MTAQAAHGDEQIRRALTGRGRHSDAPVWEHDEPALVQAPEPASAEAERWDIHRLAASQQAGLLPAGDALADAIGQVAAAEVAGRPTRWAGRGAATLSHLGLLDDHSPWLVSQFWQVHVLRPELGQPSRITLCDLLMPKKMPRRADLDHEGRDHTGALWVREERLARWNPQSKGSGDRRCETCLDLVDQHSLTAAVRWQPDGWISAQDRARLEQHAVRAAERKLTEMIDAGEPLGSYEALWDAIEQAEQDLGQRLMVDIWMRDPYLSVRRALGVEYRRCRRHVTGRVFGGVEQLIELAGRSDVIGPALSEHAAPGIGERRRALSDALIDAARSG